MKFNKYFSFIAASVLALSVASCNDDRIEDVDVNGTTNGGAYFALDLPAKVTLPEPTVNMDTVYAVTVTRTATEGALTVNVEGYNADNLFTFPQTVTFADGQATADYLIGYTYSPENFPGDTYFEIDLQLDGLTSPYGNVTYQFEAGIAAHYDPWEFIGYGTYTNQADMFGEVTEDCPLYRRESQDTPGIYQYNIGSVEMPVVTEKDGVYVIENQDNLVSEDNWVWYLQAATGASAYQPVNIRFIAEPNEAVEGDYWLSVGRQFSGYTDGNYGQCDLVGCWENWGEAEDYHTSVYEASKGLFSLNIAFVVSAGYFSYGFDYFQLDGFTNYEMELTYNGNYVNAGREYAIVYAYMNENCTSFVYKLYQGALSDEEIAQYGKELETDDTATSIDESTYLQIGPMTEDGPYTLIAVAFDGREAVSVNSLVFNFESVMKSPDQFKTTGYVAYTDAYMNTFFTLGTDPYYVYISEDPDTPGFFALEDPYGASYPWNDPGDWDTSVTSYLYVDATDPNGVWIPWSDQTLHWSYTFSTPAQNYDIYLLACYSMAGFYMEYQGATLAQMKASGYCGTFANKQITFPVDALAIIADGYLGTTQLNSGSLYYANRQGQFLIDFNDIVDELSATSYVTKAAQKVVNSRAKAFKNMNIDEAKANVSLKHQKGISVKAVKTSPFCSKEPKTLRNK